MEMCFATVDPILVCYKRNEEHDSSPRPSTSVDLDLKLDLDLASHFTSIIFLTALNEPLWTRKK